MSIEIQAGKRYVMRYGGITAPIKRNGVSSHGYYWTDGNDYWCKSGSWNVEVDKRDLIAEYTQPEPLGFELKAGERYETDGGEVVTLSGPIESYGRDWKKLFPLAVRLTGWTYCVSPDGLISHSIDRANGAKLSGARIVRPYVEPKPPTAIERLQQWRETICRPLTPVTVVAELDAIIADLKASNP